MLSYLLLITVIGIVVAFVLARFPRVSLIRVPISQTRQEHLQDPRFDTHE